MQSSYTYADGTTVPHAERNARLAARLFAKLTEHGVPENEAQSAATLLLTELDEATGVVR
jgi:hypothetical protein